MYECRGSRLQEERFFQYTESRKPSDECNDSIAAAKDNLQKYIIRGIQTDEFIAAFFASVQKVPTNSSAPAAVTMTESGIKLIYDVNYFAAANKDMIEFTLNHELLHVLNYHFMRSYDLMEALDISKRDFFSKYAPFADMPVNHSLMNMNAYKLEEKDILTYSKFNLTYEKLPTFESIVKWLHQNPEQHKSMISQAGLDENGGTSVVMVNDDGSSKVIKEGNGDVAIAIPYVDDNNKREIKEDISDLIDIAKKTAGNMPKEIERAIQKFMNSFEEQILKGWELVKHFLVGERAINKGSIRSFGRMNRRTRMIPGKKRITGFSAMMLVDESGSMSDDEVNMGFALAKKVVLRENNDKLFLVHWDTGPTQDVEELQFESDVEELKRKKSGGTSFEHFFSHEIFHRHEYDLYVCITDGYPYPWPKSEPDKPLVWIITEKGGYTEWEKNYGKGFAVCIQE